MVFDWECTLRIENALVRVVYFTAKVVLNVLPSAARVPNLTAWHTESSYFNVRFRIV